MHDTNTGITTRRITKHDVKIEDIDPLKRNYKHTGRSVPEASYLVPDSVKLQVNGRGVNEGGRPLYMEGHRRGSIQSCNVHTNNMMIIYTIKF